MTKKLDHVPAPGTRPSGERFDVTLGQRRKPTPGPAQCPADPNDDVVDSRLASENGRGKHS